MSVGIGKMNAVRWYVMGMQIMCLAECCYANDRKMYVLYIW